jgi:Ca2+-binding EF-hand superfamily protein
MGMVRLYCSSYLERVQFAFGVYDADNDGLVTKEDIVTVLSHMPMT